MSLDLTGLSTWTDENKLELIKKSVLKGRTADIIKVQGGIKNAATINLLGSTLVGQAGACGFSSLGDTALTQRTITVKDIKINESICLNDLEDYYTSTMMNPGSYNENIPFEQIFAEEKAELIQSMIEDIVWKGDTAGAGNLALADGFIKLFDGLAGTVVDGAPLVVGGMTPANAIDLIDELVGQIPADIIDADDLKIFMSYSDYRTYTKALRDANLFHYDAKEGAEFRIFVPGVNVEVVAVRGLNGQQDIVVANASNLYLGTDLLNDSENFKIFYSEDNDEVRFIAKMKIGVEVAIPEFIVHYSA